MVVFKKSISQQKIPWTLSSGQSPLPEWPPPVEHRPITASSLRPHSVNITQNFWHRIIKPNEYLEWPQIPRWRARCTDRCSPPAGPGDGPDNTRPVSEGRYRLSPSWPPHLAGVSIARVVSARLTEALDEVAALGVDLGAFEQLAPGAAPHLAWPVVELGHAAALNHREGPSWVDINVNPFVATYSIIPGQSLLKPPPQAPTAIWSPSHLRARRLLVHMIVRDHFPPVGHVAEVPHPPLAVLPGDLYAGGHEADYYGPRSKH